MTPTGVRPYYVVEWSGGGGLGHYAFLLANALASTRPGVALCTRQGHDLEGARHRQAIALVWRKAPHGKRGLRRKLVVGSDVARGWLRLSRRISAQRSLRPVVHFQGLEHVGEAAFALVLRALGATVVATVHNAQPHDASTFRIRAWQRYLRVLHGAVVHTAEAEGEVQRATRGRIPIRTLGHPSYGPLVELVGSPASRPSGPLRIASLGMVRPYKGLELVVDVFCTLAAHDDDVVLRVAGRAQDLAWAQSTLARAPRDTVSSRLEYLPLPDFIDEVRSADVLLLGHKSRSESGIAQLALAAGVPVVAPRMGALARLLETRPDWLYEPEVAADAAAKLRPLLRLLHADRGGLAPAARNVAALAPSWSAMARECQGLVDDIDRRRRARVEAP